MCSQHKGLTLHVSPRWSFSIEGRFNQQGKISKPQMPTRMMMMMLVRMMMTATATTATLLTWLGSKMRFNHVQVRLGLIPRHVWTASKSGWTWFRVRLTCLHNQVGLALPDVYRVLPRCVGDDSRSGCHQFQRAIPSHLGLASKHCFCDEQEFIPIGDDIDSNLFWILLYGALDSRVYTLSGSIRSASIIGYLQVNLK